MQIDARRRRIPQAFPVLLVAAVAAVCSSGTALAAAAAPQDHFSKPHSKLAGTWSGRYGGAFSGTFTLHWKQTGTRLRGSIALSNPGGTYGISGSVHGRAIKFGAVGVGATYTGSVSGTSMSGTYKSPQGGGTWSAKKTG